MSESKKSFWSSVPGAVTGLAGLLTGVVGLITLLVQLNVIGGDSSDTVAVTDTTTAGSPTTAAGGSGQGSKSGGEAATFDVTERTLDFPPSGPKEKFVTVKNTSKTASITVLAPSVDGENPKAFAAALETCGKGAVAPGLSCTVKVTFTPPGGVLGRYKATLQIRAAEARSGAEVDLTGSTLL